jgi:hypothetical protein
VQRAAAQRKSPPACYKFLDDLERDVSGPGLFNATINGGIVKGHCVMLVDNKYTGPIKAAPTSEGKLVLLHPDDFAKLKARVVKLRH